MTMFKFPVGEAFCTISSFFNVVFVVHCLSLTQERFHKVHKIKCNILPGGYYKPLRRKIRSYPCVQSDILLSVPTKKKRNAAMHAIQYRSFLRCNHPPLTYGISSDISFNILNKFFYFYENIIRLLTVYVVERETLLICKLPFFRKGAYTAYFRHNFAIYT